MSNGRLNIGLFICHLDNDYAYDICKGAEQAAEEMDVNLIIFPGMYINSTYNDPIKARYDYQYNSVYYYASKKNLDALIISLGTIGSFLNADIKTFLDTFKDIPILTLEIPVIGHPHLIAQGKTGLRAAITHLIEVHDKKNIGFVGGRSFNSDAIERLQVYKDTLREYNMPVKENLIVHGDFSEFCEKQVEELLDNNPDLDAIVFANDQMAFGGYQVLKRRGIAIGKDIAVTGFDDSPAAIALNPPLTTVQARVPDLGYQAIAKAITLAKEGKLESSFIDSSLIIRDSCGCGMTGITSKPRIGNYTNELSSADVMASKISEELLHDYAESFFYRKLYDVFNDFAFYLFDTAFDDKKDFDEETMLRLISEYIDQDLEFYFSSGKILYVLRGISSNVLNHITDDKKKISFLQYMNSVYALLNEYVASARYNESRDSKAQSWNASYIPRDTLNYGKDDILCFSHLIDKLKAINFVTNYVYQYDDPIMQLSDGTWRVPDKLLLTVYNNDTTSEVFKDNYIDSSDLFDNPYTPTDRRYTFVFNPIFTNDQQHGVYVCEIPLKFFRYIYSTDLQLGTAFKFLSLLKEQMATQNQLVLSLREIHDKNKQLNTISVTDALTGLYNRRGFLDSAQQFIDAPEHKGKQAIIVFADMDNLKIVNDKFGHKDGDFALKSIATTLKQSFRERDVVGRIGGDEFVAFAILDEPNLLEDILHRIDEHSAEVNSTCGKPYYIDVSTGVSEFTCGDGTSIEDLLSEADTALYNNKKYKRKSVLK